jgi:hypothetical protein
MKFNHPNHQALFSRGLFILLMVFMTFTLFSCSKPEASPNDWKVELSEKTKISIVQIDSCLQVSALRSDSGCYDASDLRSFIGSYGKQLTSVVPIASNYYQDLQPGLAGARVDNWSRVGTTFWPNLPEFEQVNYSFDWAINGQYLFTGTSPLFDDFNIGCDSVVIYTLRSKNTVTKAIHERSFYAYQGWPGFDACDCSPLEGDENCPSQFTVNQYFVPGPTAPHEFIVDHGWDLNGDFLITINDLFILLSNYCQ